MGVNRVKMSKPIRAQNDMTNVDTHITMDASCFILMEVGMSEFLGMRNETKLNKLNDLLGMIKVLNPTRD